MWFIAHTKTPGSEHVVSLDFKRALEELPDSFQPRLHTTSDDVAMAEMERELEEEFAHLSLPPCVDDREPPPPPPPSRSLTPITEPATPPPTPPPPSPVTVPFEPIQFTDVAPKRHRQKHTLLTDALIVKWVDVHGPTWRQLANSLGGRAAGWSDDTVRNRYIRILEALGATYERRINYCETPRKPTSKVGWGEDDDAFLTWCVAHHGTKWSAIHGEFQRAGRKRTQQAIRNRANRLMLVSPGGMG
jgi:hypothetical protein